MKSEAALTSVLLTASFLTLQAHCIRISEPSLFSPPEEDLQPLLVYIRPNKQKTQRLSSVRASFTS